MAQSIPAGALDILEYAFRSSPTVGSGLEQLARYVRAVIDRAAAELDIVGDALAVTWVKPAEPHRVEFAFALIVRMAREAAGFSLAPREVHFAHRPPESRLEHRAFFRSPVRFGASSNQLLFSRTDLALPLRSADPALSRIVRRRMDKMLKLIPRQDSIGTQVRRVLLDNLAGGELTAAAIARGLGLSQRTLHRRLRAENTSFADILDATRGELAKSLLPEPGIGIGEIAFLLGYSEPSAFHRFFRRWTGSTPLAYRRAARSA
jgi:AraC-like DNA-binding protein